jgi:hypothetical protein
MTKQHINTGTAANAKNGDPIRTAFDKVNANFDELYAAGNPIRYHLGDDTQFVDIDPDSGTVVIQSGFDTGMPVYIKGGNCADGGVGGNVIIEAGGAPLGIDNFINGTTGNVEIAGNDITIDAGGGVTTFSSGDGTPYVTFPAVNGSQLGIQGNEIGSLPGSNGLALLAREGSIFLATHSDQAPVQLWEFDRSGTINTPLLFPLSFTAVLDVEHRTVGDGAYSGPAWEFNLEWQVNPNGEIELIADNGPLPSLVVGYADGQTFEFTEADHSIPGYTLSIVLRDVDHNPAGYTANLDFSAPPVYPSTINSQGAIKLTSNENSLILGTDGGVTIGGRLTLLDNPAPGKGIYGTNGLSLYAKNGEQLGLYWNSDDATNPYDGIPNHDAVVVATISDWSGYVIEITTETTDNAWTFQPNGVLKLPVGGSIVDSNGDSVLGGTADTGSWTFDTVTATTDGNIIVKAGSGEAAWASLLSNNGANSFWVDDVGAHVTSNFVEGETTENYWTFGTSGSLTFPNNSTFDGQTLSNTNTGVNYTLKIANGGGAGSVFGIGTGDATYGIANDALNHTEDGYVPYTVTAQRIDLTVPGGGTWTLDSDGSLTVPGNIKSATIPQVGLQLSTGEPNFGYGGIRACFSGNTFTGGSFGDIQVGWTVGGPNGFTDTISALNDVGGGFITLTNNSWPGQGPYTFSSPDYAPAYGNNLQIEIGSASWNFNTGGVLSNDDDGYLSLRGSSIGPTSRIHLRNTDNDPTSDVNIHLQTGTGGDIFEIFQLGGGASVPYTSGLRTNSATSPILIQTNNGADSTSTWTFGADGSFTAPGNIFSGSKDIGTVTPAPLNLNNTGPVGQSKTQLNLINTAGNGGTGSAIDYYTYVDQGNGLPGARLSAVDDNNYSANFSVRLKSRGDAGNGSLDSTVWLFGSDGSLTLPAGGDIKNSAGTSVLGATLTLQAKPTTKEGQAGDLKGMIAIDSIGGEFYYCIANYTDGTDPIWAKVAGSTGWI